MRAASSNLDTLLPLLPPNMRCVILGVGSELCADDFAGMAAAQLIEEAVKPAEQAGGGDLLVLLGGSAPENLTGRIRAFAPGAVIVLDCARMGLAPGEYAVLDPKRITGATFSTHMLPLPVTLSYLETVCKCTTAYVGIEPASTEQGIGMCKAVSAGVARLAGEILALLETNAP